MRNGSSTTTPGWMRPWPRRTLLILAALGLCSTLAFVAQAWRLARQVAFNSVSTIERGIRTTDLPAGWIDILLTVEDPGFFQHHGVDLRTPGQGWTTLTQGLVKRYFPGPLSGLWGKTRQSVYALALDRQMSKKEQLDLYLNSAYFGEWDGAALIGFPAAARQLYGQAVQDLSREQFVSLVAMLVGPNHFHPLRNPKAHAQRVARIENLLAGRCHPADWQDVYLEACD